MSYGCETYWAVVYKGIGIVWPTVAPTRRQAIGVFENRFVGRRLKEMQDYEVRKITITYDVPERRARAGAIGAA